MFLKSLRDIAKPQWFEIIMLLKSSVGLSVSELAAKLKMSYMGVKQHCVELEKRGYVDTWRRPKEVGRPEKAYRLTEKANALFPQVATELTFEILETIQANSGANAAEKLLFAYFQKKGEKLMAKIKVEPLDERATILARLRSHEGHISSFEEVENEVGRITDLRIVEYHNPLRLISEKFETAYRMEEQMFERILGANVTRTEEVASGLTRITFAIT